MFNFFTIEKDQNEQGIEQENLSLSEHTAVSYTHLTLPTTPYV